MYAQLQRRIADLRRFRQQRYLPTEEDLGKNSKTGKPASMF